MLNTVHRAVFIQHTSSNVVDVTINDGEGGTMVVGDTWVVGTMIIATCAIRELVIRPSIDVMPTIYGPHLVIYLAKERNEDHFK